jgi:hypothetical protein
VEMRCGVIGGHALSPGPAEVAPHHNEGAEVWVGGGALPLNPADV